MKSLFSWLMLAMLVFSALLFPGVAIADQDQEIPEMSLSQCFYTQVSQEKDVKACDSYLENERNQLKSVELAAVANCRKLEKNVETTSPEYLRIYDVRDCHLFLEDSSFWSSIYYSGSDAPCKYDKLYKEYVCQK